jgi:hypothetical protein
MEPEGFLISKWKLFGKVFTFVNVQLHSEGSIPLEHMKEAQEEQSIVRGDQVKFIQNRLTEYSGEGEEAALWAGAFNAQLNQQRLLTDLSDCHKASPEKRNGENGKLEGLDYFTIDGKKLMVVEKGRFDLLGTHDWFFGLCNGQMGRKYNAEIGREAFGGTLREPHIFFPPTSAYYFDKKNDRDCFVRTQCPAWTDRILFNQKFAEMTRFDSFSSSGEYYGMIGRNVDIGKHKPVSLYATACVKGK